MNVHDHAVLLEIGADRGLHALVVRLGGEIKVAAFIWNSDAEVDFRNSFYVVPVTGVAFIFSVMSDGHNLKRLNKVLFFNEKDAICPTSGGVHTIWNLRNIVIRPEIILIFSVKSGSVVIVVGVTPWVSDHVHVVLNVSIRICQ